MAEAVGPPPVWCCRAGISSSTLSSQARLALEGEACEGVAGPAARAGFIYLAQTRAQKVAIDDAEQAIDVIHGSVQASNIPAVPSIVRVATIAPQPVLIRRFAA